MIFTSVDTSQPGSSHDQYVLSNSVLGMGCAMGRIGNYFLLGDSGYALRPWIMTPFARPNTVREARLVERTLNV